MDYRLEQDSRVVGTDPGNSRFSQSGTILRFTTEGIVLVAFEDSRVMYFNLASLVPKELWSRELAYDLVDLTQEQHLNYRGLAVYLEKQFTKVKRKVERHWPKLTEETRRRIPWETNKREVK